MSRKFTKEYDPSHVYTKSTVTVDKQSNKYPVIEATNNASLFPLCPQDDIDFEDFKDN